MADHAMKAWLRRLLKIDDPLLPGLGDAGVRRFRAAPGYYRYKLILWFFRQVGAATGLYFGIMFGQILTGGMPWMSRIIHLDRHPMARVSMLSFATLIDFLELTGVVIFLAQLVFSLLLVRMDFEMRWYVVTDSSLFIREGLMRMREQTLSFANIQNITIQQGPVQRLLGIADLQVRTAGGSSPVSAKHGGGAESANQLHLGYFRGVDNAPQIRDTILKRLQQLRDAGLGDLDDAHSHPAAATAPGDGAPPGEPASLLAARELLHEARALRLSVTGR